jgi:hypothetical protein
MELNQQFNRGDEKHDTFLGLNGGENTASNPVSLSGNRGFKRRLERGLLILGALFITLYSLDFFRRYEGKSKLSSCSTCTGKGEVPPVKVWDFEDVRTFISVK